MVARLVQDPGVTQALMEGDVMALGRRTAKALADALLPSSLLVCRGPTRVSRVALTFDDGPAELTSELLDVLDAYGVKATFFLLGSACALRPESVDEIVRRGHEVGGHGYTHRSSSSLTKDELIGELENTAALLPACSNGPRLVRPPKGALSLRSLFTCAAQGYTTVLWTHDSNDCRVETAVGVEDTVVNAQIRAGDILLFHEGQRWTIDALPKVIEKLVEDGHELVTVGELLRG